jgi:hypothetical protein
MNSFSKLLAGLLLFLVSFNYSCKDDDDPSGCDYVTETQDELNAVTAASDAWLADPTNSAKCQAYKDAYQAYLDELQDHTSCAAAAGQQGQLQDAINSAQASLNQLQC